MRGGPLSHQTGGGLNRLERAEGTAIYVGSGVTLARAAVFAAHHGLTGLEFAHGIPGTMGGGVFMNAGAYEGRCPKSLIGWTAWTRRVCPAACPGRRWHWVTAAAFFSGGPG
ncbi:MAG: FAD-binding protein [Evtepia gabavorous]